MNLSDITRFIGCMVLSAMLLAIPVLFTLSWALNWDTIYRFLCTTLMLGLLLIVAVSLYASVN